MRAFVGPRRGRQGDGDVHQLINLRHGNLNAAAVSRLVGLIELGHGGNAYDAGGVAHAGEENIEIDLLAQDHPPAQEAFAGDKAQLPLLFRWHYEVIDVRIHFRGQGPWLPGFFEPNLHNRRRCQQFAGVALGSVAGACRRKKHQHSSWSRVKRANQKLTPQAQVATSPVQ